MLHGEKDMIFVLLNTHKYFFWQAKRVSNAFILTIKCIISTVGLLPCLDLFFKEETELKAHLSASNPKCSSAPFEDF